MDSQTDGQTVRGIRDRQIDILARALRSETAQRSRDLLFQGLIRELAPVVRAAIRELSRADLPDPEVVFANVTEAVWNERTGRRSSQGWYVHRPEPVTEGWDGSGHYASYVWGITRNKVRDHERTKLRRAEHEESQATIPDEPAANSVHQHLVFTELLWRLLSDLRPSEREVIVLRGCAEMTFPEIAEHLGRPEEQIKAQFYRARRRLADVGEGPGVAP